MPPAPVAGRGIEIYTLKIIIIIQIPGLVRGGAVGSVGATTDIIIIIIIIIIIHEFHRDASLETKLQGR